MKAVSVKTQNGTGELLKWLEGLYEKYNRREYVHPDPVELLYAYGDVRDREIAGVVAAALAYGRAALIIKSAGSVLDVLGPSPVASLSGMTDAELMRSLKGFRHRFTTGYDMAMLLSGIRKALGRYETLEACFVEGLEKGRGSVTVGLSHLRNALCRQEDGKVNAALPDPGKGSACKRLYLFLKWMVRSDEVDPGGWKAIDPSRLLIPLDTHMFSMTREWGMTNRKSADLKTVQEVTRAFAALRPDDPLRYDFVLTRFGIRSDLDKGQLLKEGTFLLTACKDQGII